MPLRERGRDSLARQANNEGPKVQRSEQWKKSSSIFSNIRGNLHMHSLASRSTTSFQESVGSPNYKE